MLGRAPQGRERIMAERSMERALGADARIIEEWSFAPVGELSDDCSRVGPRFGTASLAKGQGSSAGDEFHADWGAR
jgi:hypothetical protein